MASPGRKGFIQTTVVGGVLFLVPFIVLLVIVEKAFNLLDKLSTPLARIMGVEEVGGIHGHRILAAVLLVGVCFLAGLLARTAWARRAADSLESNVLSNVPGYAFFKNIGQSLVGAEGQDGSQTVLARIEDAWQIGFLMERLADGQLVVFVPGAPETSSGSVYVLVPDRVRVLNVPMVEAVKVLRRLGRRWSLPVPPDEAGVK